MNSSGFKSKSLFYSFSIHLAIGLILLCIYLVINKDNEQHEVYSLINLKRIEICRPAISNVLPKIQQKVKEIKKKIKKKIKKIKADKKAKIQPKKQEIKEVVVVNEVLAPKEALVSLEPELEEENEEENEDEKEEKEVKPPELVQESTQADVAEASTPVLALSEPELSYEAQYMKDNIALINALIKKNLSYPRIAKKRGLQGKVIVSFTLTKEGEILDIKTTGTSSSILKKSAIKTIMKASKGFPKSSKDLVLQIPIVYKLH